MVRELVSLACGRLTGTAVFCSLHPGGQRVGRSTIPNLNRRRVPNGEHSSRAIQECFIFPFPAGTVVVARPDAGDSNRSAGMGGPHKKRAAPRRMSRSGRWRAEKGPGLLRAALMAWQVAPR